MNVHIDHYSDRVKETEPWKKAGKEREERHLYKQDSGGGGLK